MIKVVLKENKRLINEGETLTKSEIKDLIKKTVEEELKKLLKHSDIKDDISEVTKEVLKRLYKDLSIHHTYIIDKIKI